MKNELKVLIVANGEPPSEALLRAQAGWADRIICADGGLHCLSEFNLLPHAVVGDLDSLDPEQHQMLDRYRIPVQQHPVDKDKTDLELCLELAAGWLAGEVSILGGLGGLLDHEVGNLLAVLGLARELGLRARLVDDQVEAHQLADSTLVLKEKTGWRASLLPLDGQVSGVTLSGFRYGLEGGTLHRHRTRALSNQIETERATIAVEAGTLLVILTRPPG